MPSPTSNEWFITLARKNGTTENDEKNLKEYFDTCRGLTYKMMLVSEKTKNGYDHLHLYVLLTVQKRKDNFKESLWTLLNPDDLVSDVKGDTSGRWQHELVVKAVKNRYNVLVYMRKALDDGGKILEIQNIVWEEINEDINRAEANWQINKTLRENKVIRLVDVPAVMHTFYKDVMLKLDRTIENDPRLIFKAIVKDNTFIIWQHVKHIRTICATYELVYGNSDFMFDEIIGEEIPYYRK